MQEIYENFNFKVELTLNNNHWIYVDTYRYFDPKVLRISYVQFPDNSFDLEKRKETVFFPEPLTDIEKIFFNPALIEDKKKIEEIKKKFADEDALLLNPRRAYNGLYIYGDYFPQSNKMKVKFRSKFCEPEEPLYFKNNKKLGCLIPEMPKLGPGTHEIFIDISVNGQQFVPTNFKILHTCSDFGVGPQEIMKLDEQEIKGNNKKQPPPKKK